MKKEESTTDLRTILNSTSLSGVNTYLEEHAHIPTAYAIFNQHIKTYPTSVSAIAKNCGGYIARSYVYDVINDVKKHPSRDIVIMICLAAHMSLKQVRQLLEVYNYRELYPKDDRDVILAACFNSREYNITTVNQLLYAKKLPLLSGREDSKKE